MNTRKRHHAARVAVASLALCATTAPAASGEFDLNLMQYEFQFGQGRTQHSFYLAHFAPGGRFDELAFGDNGSVRMPLYSTNEKLWTLVRQVSSVGSDGSVGSNIANGILALGSLAAMGYAVAAQAKSIGDAFDFVIEIPTQNVTIPSVTIPSFPKPAKK
jgi:hypothetical protein